LYQLKIKNEKLKFVFAMQKPSIPKGTRDFSPAEMMRRQYIFDTIRRVFRAYGFAPLETPSMENLSTLLGKYGDEGDKLLFKILNSGDYAAGLSDEEVRSASKICEKGLRYDLTVPFARYVVQHQGELTFPFKRYQIQPVWRADRPQKGRYREFYQCDVDVIGTRSLLCEVELVEIVERVFKALGIRVALKMNNRKILFGIAEAIGHADKMMDITIAIDKLEKIGLDNVKAELMERGLDREAVDKLQPILELSGDNIQKLNQLKEGLAVSETGMKGIEEMETVFGYVGRLGIDLTVELDLSLARGLNYYTGAIFEVKALDFAIGSICGGGRYDDLTGIFGMPNMSGVGISFGADRIYDVMTGLSLFPEEVNSSTRVLFVNLGAEEEAAVLPLLRQLRGREIAAEIYPEAGKMKKQMEYANRRGIPYVVIVGSQELEAGAATVKDMRTGEQRQVSLDKLATEICNS
jgi:histidyl-tRNA synthetase